MPAIFNPPPGWPRPPDGWVPPEGWAPPEDWPAAPLGWKWRIEAPPAFAPVIAQPGVPIAALVDELSPSKARQIAMWTHLGTALVAVVGGLFTLGLGVILAWCVPLYVRATYADKSDLVDNHSTEALNFEIFTLIAVVVALPALYIFALLVGFAGLANNLLPGIGGVLIVVLCYGALLVYKVVAWIMATIAAADGRPFRYPVNVHFIRPKRLR